MSRSRLKLEAKHLGLRPQSLVHTPATRYFRL